MRLFANDLGLDLGTSNVLIYVEGRGIVVREPSVIAMDKKSGKILKVGSEARNMMGRTPGNVVAMHPLKDGIISDHVMTVKMLQHLFRKARTKALLNGKPRVVICVPSGVTEAQERMVVNAAIEAGARRVYLVEEPLVAALGANLDIQGPNGHMVVDIGGGTTDIAVLSMGDVAVSSSIKVAGDTFDEAIMRHVRRIHGVSISRAMAEDIKIQIGCAVKRPEEVKMEVRGRDSITGMPKNLELTSSEIYKVLRRPAQQIAEEVASVLEVTSPELVCDVEDNGITLTGGSSQLYGMADLITMATKIQCSVADDPDSCVAYGCGKSLHFINHLPVGVLNFAKKSAMRE